MLVYNKLRKMKKNKELRKLTPDELRAYPWCEHLSDEEAEKLINSNRRMCYILLSKPIHEQNYL